MRRRILPTALTAIGLATVLAFGTSPAPAAPPPAPGPGGQLPTPKGGKLAPADRTALARRAARHQRVSVMVLADVGQGAELAADVRAKGGTVTSADDAAGWVVASMPAGRALELERAGLVRALGIDRAVSIPRDRTATGRPDPWSPRSPRSPRSVAMAAAGQPGARRPSAGTGKVNPWLPTGDIGAPQFVGGHGRWDGRGVKLAVLDTGVDWTAAGLQRTTTGGRKVTRWQDTTGEGLVRTDTVVQVDGRSFTAAGTSWTLPAGLTVRRARFGILAESSLAPKGEGNTLAQDLNRDGDPLDRFGVAVVEPAGQGLTVYVDTDQDHSFADEGTLRDYNQAHATDTFGTDDPATPGAREVLAFGVLACSARPDNPCAAPLGAGDEPGDAWTLAFDGGTHGTHVASIAAGHDFGPGGADFSGAAPGAEVWAVRVLRSNGSGTSASIGDGIVSAASQGADVINLSLGGLSLINVGAPLDPAATLIDNVSRAYGVAFAISAGNDGPGVNTVSSPGTAAGAVTVGASIAPRTWDVNYDRPGVPSEGLLYFSATGPLEDGGFKPDVVAPGSAMASVPAWQDWTADLFPAGRLPAGYAVYQGTSMASPQVAGAQALLLSAARQTGTPSSPHALQRALELGARRLDGGSYTYQPAEVGHGLVQVGSAWAWLRRIGTTERDVASVTGNFTLGVGSGAYQRETFATEQDFRLATYGTAAHTYRLGSSAPWLRAVPGQVRVPGSAGGRPEAPEPGIGRFTAHFDGSLAFRPGLHSAVLRADDPSTKDPADLEILNTVVTPYTFSARTANTWRLRGAGPGTGIEAEKLRRFFFEVPAGAGALQLSAAGRAAERAGLVMYVTDPLGLPYAVDTDAFVPGRRSELTVPRPQAGTWEVTLHARERAVQGVADRPRDHAVVPFHGWELTAKLLSVELGPASWTVDPAVPGRQVSQAFTATNRGAAFTGAATGTELVSSNRVRREIAGSGGELRFPVTVPAGTTELAASIGNPSDGLADLDLYVYDPSGALYDSDADGDAEERVTVPDPTPGTWQIGVDPYETPRGVTDYDWRVDLARPGLGRIATSDRPEPRPTGSSWNFRASVTVPSTPPPAGWVHAGRVVVTDGSGAEVSDADLTMRP